MRRPPVLFLQRFTSVTRFLFDETVAPSARLIEAPPGVFLGTSGYSYGHWRAGVFYPRKLPQRLEVLSELPTTASGKIQKHEILRRIEERT